MRLTQDIHLVGGGVWGGMGITPGPDCNMFAVECGEGKVVLVDCGSGLEKSVDATIAELSAAGFDAGDICHILLTHAHGDHVGGAARFAAMTGADVYGSALTGELLRKGDEERSSVAAGREAGIYPPDYSLRPLGGVIEVAGGARLTLGSAVFEVFDTPGHSDGHLSFVLCSNGRRDLFAGDLVFWRGRSIMQTTIDCNPRALKQSLESVVASGSFDGLFAGHGAFVVNGADRHLKAALSEVSAMRLPREL